MASTVHPPNEGVGKPHSQRSPDLDTFPAFDGAGFQEEDRLGRSGARRSSPHVLGNGSAPGADRWRPRRDSSVHWGNGTVDRHTIGTASRHNRQRSLSEAIQIIRTRRGSVSANAHEIADALKAPVSPKLIILCGIWYTMSIMSNMSSKIILTAFPRPVTLTVIQFAFVSSYCLLFAWLARVYPPLKTFIPALKYGIRPPTRDIILTTLPLTCFQIGGHILSSDATSRIPVALVHTIKGLSPLFTVMAYRFIFHIRYSVATYLSLIPLTLGVIMACSANVSGNLIGLGAAFGSAILFVTQNIVSKKLFNEAAIAEAEGPRKNSKPDKLNLLYYSSGLSFLITMPIWLWSEGFHIIFDFLSDASIELSDKPNAVDHGRLALEYLFNGTFHFGQNLVAFVLLSMISPVTYSVASLIKRVFVIAFAIVWFGNRMTRVQAMGFFLTFLGLYLYDRTSDAAKKDRLARAMQLKDHAPLLPLATEKVGESSAFTQSPAQFRPHNSSISNEGGIAGMNGYAIPSGVGALPDGEGKRYDSPARPRESLSEQRWLPPGTKAEETWKMGDKVKGVS